MFLSHRSFVRPSLGSTRLSLRAAVRVRPCLARQCRPSVRDSVCPSASLFIPFNHCVMPFACRPRARPPAHASLPKPNQPSVHVRPSVPSSRPYPFDRPSDREKHLKQLAARPAAGPRPWERREKRENRLHSTSLPPTQYLDRRGTTTETHRRPPPEAPPAPGGREGETEEEEEDNVLSRTKGHLRGGGGGAAGGGRGSSREGRRGTPRMTGWL